jgi:type I restriction enzyme S subunit
MDHDLRPGWSYRKLNELGFVGRGKSRNRPRNDPSLYGGPYPFFQTGDVKAADLYLWNYSQTYNEKGLAQSKLWEPGTLCITIAANIAESAILKIRACFPDSIVGFVADPEKTDVRFVKYAIDTMKLRMQSISRGTTQDNLSLDKLLTFEIPTPPLPTQRKIAAILSAYDDLIENNARRIRLLEEMARLLYREWFVRFHFPGHASVRLVDSSLGPIPEGWEVKSLGDIAQEVRRGIKPDEVERDTPYVGLEHLPRKSIALSEWGTAQDATSTKLAFREGEILFGKIRPYFHKVVVAPVDGICSTDTIVMVPKTPDYFPVVLACVSSEPFVEYASQTSQGTKMPRADWKVLAQYPVAIPPRDVLLRFSSIIQDSVAQIFNLIHRKRNLRCTRDLLLPRLVAGTMDVSNLDTAVDERGGAMYAHRDP